MGIVESQFRVVEAVITELRLEHFSLVIASGECCSRSAVASP
jgi:hypothetical protein